MTTSRKRIGLTISTLTGGLVLVAGFPPEHASAQSAPPGPESVITAVRVADAPDIDGDRARYDLFSPDMEPGDVLIFNAQVVHGSSANTSTSPSAVTIRADGFP